MQISFITFDSISWTTLYISMLINLMLSISLLCAISNLASPIRSTWKMYLESLHLLQLSYLQIYLLYLDCFSSILTDDSSKTCLLQLVIQRAARMTHLKYKPDIVTPHKTFQSFEVLRVKARLLSIGCLSLSDLCFCYLLNSFLPLPPLHTELQTHWPLLFLKLCLFPLHALWCIYTSFNAFLPDISLSCPLS